MKKKPIIRYATFAVEVSLDYLTDGGGETVDGVAHRLLVAHLDAIPHDVVGHQQSAHTSKELEGVYVSFDPV